MKRNLFLGLLSLTMVLAMWGCEKESEQANFIGSLHGVITDKTTGEPIKSAGVQINPSGIKTVTGSEGQYEFTELQAGDYTLKITKTGYVELLEYKIYVEAGKANKVDVQMEKLPPSLRIVNDKKNDIDTLNFDAADADVSRSFSIFNDGESALEWEISQSSAWIAKISKESGTLNAGGTQGLIVTIDREKLLGGENTTTMHVTSNNGSKQLTVRAVGKIKVLPTLNTTEVKNIMASTATFTGKIVGAGTPAYTERGFVYATTSTPTLATTIAKLTVAVTPETDFSVGVTGLVLNQTYYVRAYAINGAGTAYSTNEVSFKPTAIMPKVITNEVSNKNIGAKTVTFNGNIEGLGDPSYTERGFVYGLVHNPTIDDDNKKLVSGVGLGVFSSNLTDLIVGNTYYVRAFATNVMGTAYGTEVICDFKTIAPEVTTLDVLDVNVSSATLKGKIVSVGDPAYNERGFVYGTNHNPTTTDTKKVVAGSGTGEFSVALTALIEGTTYYVRAYTISAWGTSYGEMKSFIAQAPKYVVLATAKLAVASEDVSGYLNFDSANSLCENSTLDGFTDWRLPTINELATMYANKDKLQNIQMTGYYGDYYWSSTLDGPSYRKVLSFSSGHQTYEDIFNSSINYCRCVRSIP